MENEIEINGTTYVRKDSVQQTPTNKDGDGYGDGSVEGDGSGK